MDSPIAFCLAVLTLLAVPGPTNTLLMTSGATAGFRRSLPLLLGELGGYSISIMTLRAVVGALSGGVGGAETVLRVLAAIYLAYLSVKLWRSPSSRLDAPVTIRNVFATTLLNPKALVFGLVIFPAPPTNGGAYLAAFAVMAMSVGAMWILAGDTARSLAGDWGTSWVPKIASLALAGFAVFVFSGAFQ